MKKFSIIIIDDEPAARETLAEMIKLLYPEATIVGEASDKFSAIELLNSTKADIVLLDIDLGNGTSFDVLDEINKYIKIQPIFTTAFEQYALKAFRYDAIQYLLKPIDIDSLKTAIDRQIALLGTENAFSDISKITAAIAAIADEKRIIISDKDGWNLITISDILYFEADGSYCKIHVKDKGIVTSSRNLKYNIQLIIDKNALHHFVKVHRSHVVNKRWIDSYEGGDTNTLTLKNGATVAVALTTKELQDLLT